MESAVEWSCTLSMENGSTLKSPCQGPDIKCPMLVCITGLMKIHRFLSLVLKLETAYCCQCQKEQRLDLGLNHIYLKALFPQMYVLIGKQTGEKKKNPLKQTRFLME